MFCIINLSGKQYLFENNKYYDIDYINSNSGDVLILNQIILINYPNNKLLIGKPILYPKNEKFIAYIIQNFRTKKIKVMRYKSKKHYKKYKNVKPLKTRILFKVI